MYVQKVDIKGFPLLRDVKWQPRGLSVVISPNGYGKSNLLRALTLLQEAGSGEL
jgi:predicted ATPase